MQQFHMGAERVDVMLCCMPWVVSRRPSLALGLMKGICSQEAISSKVIYCNFDLAARIGMKLAGKLAANRALFGLSEHLFACALYGKEALDSDRFIGKMSVLPEILEAVPKDFWFYARDEVIPEFLESTTERILDSSPSILGLTATFNQVMASLAVAKLVKENNPKTITIFGGACFHDPMGQEYHKACSEFVDHIFLGEADDSFRLFIKQWRNNDSLADIAGVTYNKGGVISFLPSSPVTQLDRLPVPNYDDYYLEAERLKDEPLFQFVVESLPYESSRGCWWGQKSHCVFCGLNSEGLTFRTRGVDRIVEDIVTLSRKYQETNLFASDLIVSWPTLTKVLRKIAALNLDLVLFYEVKASVKKHQFELLRNAGVNRLQPGIESFSTESLQLMGKGTTLLTNLQFLKWSKEYNIHPVYNLLMGFPNEQSDWYGKLLDMIPLFHHLEPPGFLPHLLELHRFSPLYEKKENFGLGTLLPRPDYLNCFPEGVIDLNKCSYYFYEEGYEGWLMFSDYMQEFRDVVGEWINLHKSNRHPPSLQYRLGDGFIKISDFRSRPGRVYKIVGEYCDLVLMCDRIQVRASLEQKLGEKYGRSQVSCAIEALLERGILIQEGKKILSLAVATHPRLTNYLENLVFDNGTNSKLLDGPSRIERENEFVKEVT